jgi:hypothetical protein
MKLEFAYNTMGQLILQFKVWTWIRFIYNERMFSSKLSQDFRIKKQHKHFKWHRIQKEKGDWKKYNTMW